VHTLVTGEDNGYYADFGTIEQLARAIKHAFVYEGQYAPGRKRCHGKPTRGIPRSRFLGYIQTHDQVGNRAKGDRIGHLASAERVKVGAALVLTSPSVPMLFQGEEWNASTPFCYFTDHEPGLAELVRQGRRSEFAAFGWDPHEIPDPNAPETFDRSKLVWSERDAGERGVMLAWYRDLIHLRSELPELRGPVTEVWFDEAEKWLLVDRPSVIVAANLAEEPRHFDVGSANVRLASHSELALSDGRLTLPPNSVAVLTRSSR
jgi:maltooligosyltrehalose trehalohydrolase